MTYRQLSPEERYMLAALRRQGFSQSEIARHSAATAQRSVARSGVTAPARTATTAPSPRRNAPTAGAPARAATAFYGRGVRPGRGAAAPTVEPRTGLRLPAPAGAALDQPRDHLPPCLAGQAR